MRLNPSCLLLAVALAGGAAAHSPLAPRHGAAVDIPNIEPDSKETYHINLAPADPHGLEARMAEAAQPGGQWLSHEELKRFTSAKPAHVEAVRSFLVGQGIHPKNIKLGHLHDSITFTGTPHQARSIWGSRNHKRYTHDLSLAADHSLQIPRHLQDAIVSIRSSVPHPAASTLPSDSSSNNRRKNMHHAQIRAPEEAGQTKKAHATDSCNESLTTPTCLHKFYGVKNQTLHAADDTLDVVTILLAGSGADAGDTQQYLQRYRPDLGNAASFQLKTNVSAGHAEAPGSLGHGSEGFLDVQTIAGMAAPLNVGMIKYGSAETEDVTKLFTPALRYILDRYKGNKLPGVISVSFGADETDVDPADAQEFCSTVQKLTAQGTTVVFAAGDAGVAGAHGTADGCKKKWTPPYPSGCPYVLSVGGTQGVSEIRAVDGDKTYFSGAGFSNLFSQPEWQKSHVEKYISTLGSTGQGKYNASGRAFPDIAAAGLNLPVVVMGRHSTDSGTSASAPVAASVIALANHERQQNGKPRLGYLHPRLYASGSKLTTDITHGSTGAQNCAYKLPATPGWDLASGLGSLSLSALVDA